MVFPQTLLYNIWSFFQNPDPNNDPNQFCKVFGWAGKALCQAPSFHNEKLQVKFE